MVRMEFDDFVGSPVYVSFPVQLNIMVHKVDKVKVMKNFPEALLPLIWFEEEVVLPKFLINKVKQGHMALKFVR